MTAQTANEGRGEARRERQPEPGPKLHHGQGRGSWEGPETHGLTFLKDTHSLVYMLLISVAIYGPWARREEQGREVAGRGRVHVFF